MVSLADTKVGVISHYFDKIGVAFIDLLAGLKAGDLIKISDHGNEFEQEVTSMQMEHENIKTAKKGQNVGLKVDQPVKKGAEVFRV